MTKALIAYRTPFTLVLPVIPADHVVVVSTPYGAGTLASHSTIERRALFLILAGADALDVWVHQSVTGENN